MSGMVKCPICGMDVSPEEYGGHYDSHGRGGKWGRFAPGRISPGVVEDVEKRKQYIRKLLGDMRSSVVKRDFEGMLKAGVEASVELGKRFPENGSGWALYGAPVYNSIVISLLSGYKSDWDTAIRFVDQAVETTRR